MILIDIFKPDCNKKKCCLNCKKSFCRKSCFLNYIPCKNCFYKGEKINNKRIGEDKHDKI